MKATKEKYASASDNENLLNNQSPRGQHFNNQNLNTTNFEDQNVSSRSDAPTPAIVLGAHGGGGRVRGGRATNTGMKRKSFSGGGSSGGSGKLARQNFVSINEKSFTQ